MSWAADFGVGVTKNVQTILLIANQQPQILYFRVGNLATDDYWNNPECIGGQLQTGGFLNCQQSGRYLAITSLGNFRFTEVMAYSQYFIQNKASSSTIQPGTLTTALNYFCGTSPNCQAQNVLISQFFISNDSGTSPCCIYSTESTDPALTVTLPAQVEIEFVVIIPSDQHIGGGPNTQLTNWQKNIQVFINSMQLIQEPCGTLLVDYNTYKEVPCHKQANQIIIKRPGTSMTLAMAGLAIMSNCDCGKTSFDPKLFTSLTQYAFSGLSTDTIKTLKVMPDTVSSVCGLADGFSQCPHSVIFYDSSSNAVTFPHNGFTWNSATFVLSLDPAQAQSCDSLIAIVSIISYPFVTRTQKISSAIDFPIPTSAPSAPVAPVTAIYGTDVAITWVASECGSSAITDYNVAIRQSNGVAFSIHAGCTGTTLSCTVPISVLQASPYNLGNGASVYAKVQAINSVGTSAQSPEGNTAVLPTVPSAPAAPTTVISGSEVIITWLVPGNGGQQITSYTVAIQQSDGNFFNAAACNVSNISCTTTCSCAIQIATLQAAPYNLFALASIHATVLATNSLGSSSASTPSYGAVIAPKKPFMFIPNMTLNAVIGQEASFLLPKITDFSYFVLSSPRFQVSVEGNLLKVKSNSVSEIGQHKLQMNAKTSNQSANFDVNVIFRLITIGETANNTSKTGNLVLSVQESDSLLETTSTCNTNAEGILFCVTYTGYFYSLDPNKSAKAANSEVLPENPTLKVSRVDSRGSFSIKFSQPMNILTFKNTTNDWQLQVANATTQNDMSEKYKYLLSPKHLRLKVKSENTTQPKFTWYAKNITNTNIEIQLVFDDPLSISNDRSFVNMLEITVLPPALRYFKTLASGALTKNPLETLTLSLPTQSIPGTVMDSVSKVALTIEKAGQLTALGNLATQFAVSGSMAKMWSMVNAFQIVNTFNYLNTNSPGNVKKIMINLNDMLALSALETDEITSSLFNFTETLSPGVQFNEMENDSKVLTEFIGNQFYIGAVFFLVYILYGFVHGCGYSDRRCQRFDLWLLPKLIWSALICYQLETSLDFGIGTLLKFEEPNLNTTGDIFDLGLSIAAVICLLVLPLTQIISLCKNKVHMGDRKFKEKWGSFYEGFKTFTPGQRETAIKMFFWFLFRRIVTALNLVELRNQTVWIQLTLNMWLCLADACLIFHWSPYEDTARDIMEKFNSAVVLLLSQLVWMQTDLIPSAEDRYYIGWYYLGALAIMFVTNISVVVISALKYPKDEFKRCLLNRKQRKALAVKLQKLVHKNSMLTNQKNMKTQKNGLPPGTVVDEPPVLYKRALIVFKIKALKMKVRVDHAKVKQLEKKLVSLDEKRVERRFYHGSTVIDAEIKRHSESKTLIEVKVRVQQSKQIDNIPSVDRHRILLEQQASEARLKDFYDQRQKVLEHQRQQQQFSQKVIFLRMQQLKYREKAKNFLEERQRWAFEEHNQQLEQKMQEIEQKREEDAILQFARQQKRGNLERSNPRPETEYTTNKILFRRKYLEEEQRRIRKQKALAAGWNEEEFADKEYLRILNKLQNKEQVSEQEMSVLDLERQKPSTQKPSAQHRNDTDAEFSFRDFK